VINICVLQAVKFAEILQLCVAKQSTSKVRKPFCLPDVAPGDFFLFHKLKNPWKVKDLMMWKQPNTY